ncbi:hypothetical protein ADIAL_1328 [Alkalibacterium sp. AK22]|uniref:GNAT family N-acetyltransferase n=1 Tax=Alkalibacterium sp. AK22 TaxID=1229520 RepID=UPI00044B818B|nr:GNAT family N-acetyltransferase [Alkalibacterium sp. AK22]EXJ23181.1 hypothetical protein ADIAL_1328 [Alkalibacterium sp. AK22]
MTLSFRQLTLDDYSLYEQMETGLEQDYMLRVFERLVSENNRLYGMFEEDILVAVAGYTIFCGEFAMLGRLRSDARYRKQGYGTIITKYILDAAREESGVTWIGANTEQHNIPAQKVLQKLNMPHQLTLYAAQAETLGPLLDGQPLWQEITELDNKKKWLEETYLNPSFGKQVFPYEAYYPFPASPAMFSDRKLMEMHCYVNPQETRVVFMWEEEKGEAYLHVVYPWFDLTSQAGLFDTISSVFEERLRRGTSSKVWIDLTEEEAADLPADHPFDLPSPWMLHGFQCSDKTDSQSHLKEAKELLDHLEQEIKELNTQLDTTKLNVKKLSSQFDQLDL